MEGVALDKSSECKPGSLCDSETLDCRHGIRRTGRSETTARTKEERSRMLIEMDQNYNRFFDPLVDCSPFHKIKSPLNSFSAS